MKDDDKRQIFRKEALERLSSPEKLDQLMQVVTPLNWLSLTTLAILLILGLIWSIVAKIPITVTGKGVLLYPRSIAEIQSPIGGQLESLKVKVGDCVNSGQILAIINPLELRQKLELQRQKLTQLEEQTQQTNLLRQQGLQLQENALIAQENTLKQQLVDKEALSPLLREKTLNSLEQQRQSLEKRLLDAQNLAPLLEARLAKRKELLQEGALSEDNVLMAQQEYLEIRQQIADIETQLKQLEVQKTELEQRYLDNLNQIKQINAQLAQIASQKQLLTQNQLEITITKNNQIDDLKREIKQLEQQITIQSQIRSPQTGCLLEITKGVGQVISPGTSLGKLNTNNKQSEMIAIIYLPIKDAKKIKPGMSVQITPDTVQKERFGGILGNVTHVSTFPVTEEGATFVLGNSQLAKSLLGENEPKIEVKNNLHLDPDTFSGYKWSSSQGPNLTLTEGTTITAQVEIETRSPISLILPYLKIGD